MNADAVELLRKERAELVEFLSSLDDADWSRQSLCADWTVRDVTAHLASVVGLTRRGLLARMFRYGTGTDGANARTASAWSKRGTEQLLADLADPKRLGLGFFHPRWALGETVVHHQDIRRALGRPREIPEARLVGAIDVLVRMPFLTRASREQRRIRIRATDIDLVWGRKGPEITGPAESLMMALAGRTEALAELQGETDIMA